jgi:hypothetical protein
VTFTHDIEVTPAEIRQAWATIMAGRNPFSDRQDESLLVRQNLRQYRSADASTWIGASGAEIQRRLEHGYHVESKDLDVIGGATEFSMPFMALDEDSGDLLIDQVLSGEDLYRVQWEETETPKSLTIRACIGMAAITSAEVLASYMTWLLKVIDAAQRQGVSPNVELWFACSGGFLRSKDTMRVRIPLVKAGEMVDVDSWRAFLTPGAFRSLGFVALGLATDRTPRRLTPGMGAPTNRHWTVNLADGVLDIECPARGDDFPEEFMDGALKAAQAGA